MYSEQLRRILGEIEPSTRAHFRGVFAIDELTQTRCKPGSYVINLDKRDEPGSHWVAVYVDPNKTFNNYDDEEEEDEDEGSLAPTETRLSAAAAADKATPSTTTTTQFMHVPHTAQTRHPSSRQRCGMLVEYFDSYGRAPPSPELNRFLGRFAAAAAAASHRRHQHPHHRRRRRRSTDSGSGGGAEHGSGAAAGDGIGGGGGGGGGGGATASTVSTKKTPRCVWYNSTSLQPVYTGSCGFYCLYFILHRAMGQTAADIVHRLSRIDSHFHVKSYVLARYSLAFH